MEGSDHNLHHLLKWRSSDTGNNQNININRCVTYFQLYNSYFLPSNLIEREAFHECWYRKQQHWDF